MKRTNISLEKLALWFITQKKTSSFKLMSLINENHFGNKGNLAAFKRIKFVARKRNEVMSWDDVQEDSAIPEATRLILQAFDKTTPINASRANEIYLRLEELRKKRVIFDGLKAIVEEKLLKNVDIDEIVNTDLTDLLTQARSPNTEDELFTVGRNGNSDEVMQQVITRGLHVIPTGFKAWDRYNGGVICPSVFLLGSGSGGGKSILGDVLANNFVDYGAKTCITSLEMDIEELTVRRLSAATGIDQTKILLNDRLSENDKQKIRKAFQEKQQEWDKQGKSLHTYVPRNNPTIEELLLRLQPMGFKVYVIDYITLLAGVGGQDQWKKLVEVVQYAKTFTRINNCVVVILVQISEEEKLLYSKAIMHPADLAWFWTKNQTVMETGVLQINCPKARKQKPISFNVKADYEHACFTDLPDDYKPPKTNDLINPELKNKVKTPKTGGDKLMNEFFSSDKKTRSKQGEH